MQRSSVSTSVLFSAERGRRLGPLNSSMFWFLPLVTEALPNKYMIESFCTVSSYTMKSTHAFWFPLQDATKASPSHLGCKGWQTQLQTVTSNMEILPPAFFILLNTSRVERGILFSFKIFSPHQQCFGIWSLGGNVSIRVHTTLPVQIKVISQGFAATSSSLRQVDDRYPLVHTAALSAESVHFTQSRVLPRCRMWALKTTIIIYKMI